MTLMGCCILSGDTRRPCTLSSNREYQSFEKNNLLVLPIGEVIMSTKVRGKTYALVFCVILAFVHFNTSAHAFTCRELHELCNCTNCDRSNLKWSQCLNYWEPFVSHYRANYCSIPDVEETARAFQDFMMHWAREAKRNGTHKQLFNAPAEQCAHRLMRGWCYDRRSPYSRY